MDALLGKGVDPNYYPHNVPPPLHLAAMAGNGDIIRSLMAAGSNLHAIDFVKVREAPILE